MSVRPSRAKSAHTPEHRIPIGLQIVAIALESYDLDRAYLKEQLKAADVRAVRILQDPLLTLEAEGPNVELADMAAELGAEEAANRIAAAIPESATHDPRAWVTAAVVPYQTAGLWLGLCLGYRIAAGLIREGE
jgi:hypothetical protein